MNAPVRHLTPLTDAAPPEFPPAWAVAWGSDVYGLWAQLAVGEVVQRLRWIPPGEFWMGSLKEEPESIDEEHPRHRVILTQGYWLADTACTQGLWQAVIGNNPSHFKGDPELPVENVSWKDIQEDFLQKLSEQTGQQAELPSEAEWEYACRAGTSTPFWWGEVLTTADANYNGNVPYNNGELGEYRERTVPVKTFKPNPWGLWEMHGNVWEWCRDDWRTYAEAVAVDPEGPPGEGRALRGGSWFNRGGNLRAANRNTSRPGFRYHDYGFRFLLRSPSSEPGWPGA